MHIRWVIVHEGKPGARSYKFSSFITFLRPQNIQGRFKNTYELLNLI